ncbi:MAG: phosphodiester glycosidase family protein [Clostridia bacterium]|nr:phosphodiester glycosidase family protein [Clostridia bacterium]
MKLPVRIALSLVCAALVLAAPFTLSSPNLLGEARMQMQEQLEGDWDLDDGWDPEADDDDWLESGLMKLLFPAANAEEEAEDAEEDEQAEEKTYSLPIDLSAGLEPNPAAFTEAGYEDDSIRVQMETREEDGVIWRIAWVEVASPTQLRTGIAGTIAKPGEKKVRTIAESCNAVVALNGDYFKNNPTKTSFEYRMGQKIRSNTNKTKDMLIIDENGGFHIVMALEKTKQQDAIKAVTADHKIVNAFTFGPALVSEGKVIKTDKHYGYNPEGKEPRSAIGQTGPLSYVFVVAEGRGKSAGVTHQQLANFMGDSLHCVAAYNLDGGGSATLVFNGKIYNKLGGSERQLSDIIYFATAVDPKEWK